MNHFDDMPAPSPRDYTNVPRETRPWGVRAFTLDVMGMVISLHVRATDPTRPDIEAAAERAWDVLRDADATFSTYRADSELMRLRRRELDWSNVSDDMRHIKALCDEAASVTGGLFTSDLTGPDGTRGFDPTGLVKGWAAEKAANVLRGVPEIVFCLNAAGDLVADHGSGHTPDVIPTTWRIGIAHPHDNTQVTSVVEVKPGQALATSGTGERGSHIIDPRTGAPAKSELSSVTVVGPNLTWADVWATCCLIDQDALVFSRMAASYRVAASA